MPDAFELPGVLRAVEPLVRCERLAGLRGSVVDELVALPLGHTAGARRRLAGRRPRLVPGFAAVIGALNDLPEPAARLGCIDPIGINRRPLHVIDLPTGKVGAVNIPSLALGVRCEDEGALAGADQNA